MRKRIFSFIFWALILSTAIAQQVDWLKQFPIYTKCVPTHVVSLPGAKGIVVSGVLGDYYTDNGSFICSVDSSGSLLWADSLGDKKSTWGIKRQTALAGCSDGSVFFGGNFFDTLFTQHGTIKAKGHSSIFMIKYDENGQWLKTDTFFSTEYCFLQDLAVDAADNLFILLSFRDTFTVYGQTFFAGSGSSALALKISASGQLAWTKQFSGWVSGNQVVPTPSGNVMVIGNFYDTLWFDTQVYVPPSSSNQNPYPYNFSVTLDANGNIISQSIPATYASSLTEAEMLNNDIYATYLHCWTGGCWTRIQKINASYGLDWYKNPVSYYSYGSNFILDKMTVPDSSGFWLFGYVKNCINYGDPNDDIHYFALLKYDLNGTLLQKDSFPVTTGLPGNIVKDEMNALYMVGSFTDTLHVQHFELTNSQSTLFIAKTKSSGVLTSGISTHDQLMQNDFYIYPNPSKNCINLSCAKASNENFKLVIRNVLGQTVFSDSFQALTENYTRQIDLGAQPKGIYFAEIVNENKKLVKRFVLQ